MADKKEIMEMLNVLLESKLLLHKWIDESNNDLKVEFILCSDVSEKDAKSFTQNLAYVMNIAADNYIYENCSFRSNTPCVSNIW